MIDYDAYTVGWICAIRAELVAAQELLDEELEDIVPTPEHDNNNYTLGKIGEHHVVIAVLPRGQYGGTSAANAARDMIRTFPNVRIGFMVGIGGGIPTQYDIRLGDIVVGSPTYRSGGLIQYDHGTTVQGQDMKLMGALNQPPLSVLTAINSLSSHHVRKGNNLNQTVEDVLSNNPNLVDEGFQRPHDDTDKLYESSFIHPRPGAKCSDVCPDSNLKSRSPRTKGLGQPKIHYGLIASGSQLMEDAIARDRIAEKENVLCFEMEAAGLANQFPCVVIRGICDYSDSHRGRDWQGYAALVAAAYAKQLLLRIPPQKIQEERKMKDILQEIEERLGPIAETKEIVEALNIKGEREDELKILDWLDAADYSSEQHGFLQPQQREPGTGQQFINSENFETWLKTKNSLLFCCGMPGAGKTITTAITIEYLHSKFKDDPTVGVAYVYCSYQKRDQQTPQDLFTSFLKQLALSLSSFPKAMQELYKKNHNGRERPSFEDIMETLYKVVDVFSTTFIIIDALDEHNSWDTFLSHVILLQKQTTANVFITSRPKPALSDEIKGCLMHDIQADEEDNVDLSKKAKEDCRELIREKLGKAVDGIFLLARIYLDSLMEETNLKGISVFLQNLPIGLRAYADAYEKTIRRIRNQGQKHRDLARRALTWLTFARRSLRREEFRHALSVEDGMSELKDEDLQSISIIHHVCMGLVMVDEESGTVRLLHFTTMEYLKANPNCLLSLESSDDPNFIDNPADSEMQRHVARKHYEMKLATTCVTYLLFEEFSRGRVNFDEFKSRCDEYPLYSYAADNWGHHARHNEPSKMVLDFLKNEPHASASTQCWLGYNSGVDEYGSFYPITSLHLTAIFGLKTETDYLLSSGMEPDIRDEHGRTPLSYASELGHADLVTQLLKFPVDPESKSFWGGINRPRTALSHAAKEGHADVVTLLLEKGKADPDSKPSFYGGEIERTPLSFASQAGHLDVVDILLEALGTNLNFHDYAHCTPLHYAVKANHIAIVDLMLAKDSIDPNLKSLLAKDSIDTDFRDKDGKSLLHYMAQVGDETIVTLLLAKCANPDLRDISGKSPLHYTAEAGHSAIAEILIATKMVDPDSSDTNGRTPLSLAARAGNVAVVQLLLTTNKIRLASETSGHHTLFPTIVISPSNAQQSQSLDDIIKAMVVNGCVDVNSKDHDGWTPLFHAAFHGYRPIVNSFLLLPDTNPNVQDVDGRTILSYAVAKDPEVAKLLLSYKDVEPDLEDRNMRTPLSYAAECGNELIVKLLLQKPGVNPNSMDISGRTPLSYAAEGGNFAAGELLIADTRVQVDSQDMSEQPPADMLPESLLPCPGKALLDQHGKKRKYGSE
ncbi:hypothetical protein FAUST_1850 [Fusarium austroamericanum]|uniref:Nucleoside phosphorylase domain-containing protein n=1 Tax=Fusarium austroamericanum TaxID=282268 RepID=A0AAN6HJ52_FUSAU|nr:hypothetical protein FAUST_1850 [Fusarium austroamericanum]